MLRSYLPHENWAGAVARLGYVFGFVVVTFGRQQLYTESTLTVVLPVLYERTARSLGQMLRVWASCCLRSSWALRPCDGSRLTPPLFSDEMTAAFAEVGRKAIEPSFGTVLLRGILAGWLISLIAWLSPAAEGSARLWVIVLLSCLWWASRTLATSSPDQPRACTSSGRGTWGRYLVGFLLPAFLGNTIGGVGLTAL